MLSLILEDQQCSRPKQIRLVNMIFAVLELMIVEPGAVHGLVVEDCLINGMLAELSLVVIGKLMKVVLGTGLGWQVLW